MKPIKEADWVTLMYYSTVPWSALFIYLRSQKPSQCSGYHPQTSIAEVNHHPLRIVMELIRWPVMAVVCVNMLHVLRAILLIQPDSRDDDYLLWGLHVLWRLEILIFWKLSF